jgi:predicted O-methyltransferase YrrM
MELSKAGIIFETGRGALCRLIESLSRRGRMVEVGSAAGISTEIFAAHFDEVISIDPYLAGYDDSDTHSAPAHIQAASDLWNERMRSLPHVKQIREKSPDAARHFADESLDFVYIDACHLYAAVQADIDAWLPKIKPGGAIGGHDFSPKYPGVQRAVWETFKEPRTFSGTHWIVRL